jgi:hypothetical protein
MDYGDLVAALYGAADAGAQDARLEQLARLKAAKYWRRPSDEDWSREATFLFRTAGEFMYAVFPIFRRRYYAVVRVLREDIADPHAAVRSDHFEVVAISVFEPDALSLATNELSERP